MKSVIRLCIVDPNDSTRAALKQLLLGIDAVWLEAECSTYEEFSDVAMQTQPDIALLVLDSNPDLALETLTEITQQYQYGGEYKDTEKHPFSKYFEELEVGDTVITAKRTVTETDIVTFANVSWDHFYAHTDVTSLEGTTFEQRVAHGYFVLSAAAGLFVQAKKGPVLLNYGLEECRFTKPVYAGMTIGVRATVKEKVDQEKKDDIAKGIVKFLIDVYDETNETVAIATILTMIKKKDQG